MYRRKNNFIKLKEDMERLADRFGLKLLHTKVKVEKGQDRTADRRKTADRTKQLIGQNS